jgi:nitrite reductase/ring-hydroxylating ferredoxin subunit
MNTQAALGRLDEIPDGDARGFDPQRTGRDTLFVVRRGQRAYGYFDRCPHEGVTPLPWRKNAYLNADHTLIVCAAHGAQFDVESGICIRGACLGEALTPVSLTVDIEGRLRAVPGPWTTNGASINE